MLNTRKFQTISVIVLIVAATLVTLSAIRLPAPAFIPVSSNNADGLAQYQRSERSAYSTNQTGLALYFQSERLLAYPASSNEKGLAIYHLSERSVSPAITNGLDLYHQSERGSYKAGADGMAIYHQSEWFGK